MVVASLLTLTYNSRQASTFASRNSIRFSWYIFYNLLFFVAPSGAAPSVLERRQEDPAAEVDTGAAPATKPYDPKSYLPAQIGGIVGSYAVSLVLVALALLLLSKRRREHLTAGENEAEFLANADKPQYVEPVEQYPEHWAQQQQPQQQQVPSSPRSIPRSPVVLGVDRDYSPASSISRPFQFPLGSTASAGDRAPFHQAPTSAATSADRAPFHHHPAAFPPSSAATSADRAPFHPPAPFPPTSAETAADRAPYVAPSPTSTVRSPLGIDSAVDQTVVQKDKDMAQAQLEEMYKYVMEQEDAKKKGIVLEAPPIPLSTTARSSSGASRPSTAGAPTSKKEKMKPAALNLGGAPAPEKKSRTSSLFSALRSPRKSKSQAMSISSPIMTPMSGTFPRESQEMNTIPPRQYAPAKPPPVPTDQHGFHGQRQVGPLTPDYSPDSSQSIDERLGGMFSSNHGQQTGFHGQQGNHSRNTSAAPTEEHPQSAISDTSQTPLVGLPSSPKPNATRFPSLPASPKPGQTFPSLPLSPKPGSSFSRPNAPSAVRTGGTLPLRAYEPPLASPSASSAQTKQTTFERMAPLSPRGAMTPYTGTAVPYSPYQPFSPCVPITPSLVTKADRKRMKRLEPKTPTVELVKSSEDIW